MRRSDMKMGSRNRWIVIDVGYAAAFLLVCGCGARTDIPNESKTPAPLARMSGVAAPAKGKLYFIGGITKTGGATGVVHEFDPQRNDWSTKSRMPTSRASAAAVGLNEYIYVLGGRTENEVLSTVEKYEPTSDRWSKCAPMPTPRWHLMAAMVDGKIYAMGGIAGVGSARRVLDVLEVYDPSSDSWSSMAPTPIAISNAGAVAIDHRIYLIGGRVRAGADASGSATSKVYVYDTATAKWQPGPPMNQERTGLEACAVKGTIFAVGGASRGSNTASIEVLTPGENEWVLLRGLRKGRTDHNCAVLGHKIYVIGGLSKPSIQGIESTIEELSPAVTR